jgi:hypothetical protein
MKHELQSIISGKSEVRNGAVIQATACYLKGSQRSSELAKGEKLYKKQEAKVLKDYISKNNLLFPGVEIENYVSEGSEQKVYLKDGRTVIKLNDAIFYESWEDYLNCLLLHNFFFPDTAYELLGFYLDDQENIFAVVQQPFVRANEKTDLLEVKNFMEANGFANTRNNDYYNDDLGVILEDLHDENVLTENGVLQFIDTVFYITEKFYK